MRVSLAVLVVLLAGFLAGAVAYSGAAVAADGDVYRLTVTATSAERTYEWTEWVAPQTGRFRIDDRDQTTIYIGSAYALVDARRGAHVRSGSAPFLGSAPERSAALAPLRTYLSGSKAGIEVIVSSEEKTGLRFRRGDKPFVAVIEEKLTAAEAEARKLLAIPTDRQTSSTVERRVGARPTLPIRAYWFGAQFAGRSAVAAVEYHAHPPRVQGAVRAGTPTVMSHTTFYELPAARGRSSALPGQRPPVGEIQVLSQPVSSASAQRAIKAYNGVNGSLRYKRWPRLKVTLRNGERVTVIPDRSESTGKVRNGFAVVTQTTLVNVIGPFPLNDIPASSAALVPLGVAR